MLAETEDKYGVPDKCIYTKILDFARHEYRRSPVLDRLTLPVSARTASRKCALFRPGHD